MEFNSGFKGLNDTTTAGHVPALLGNSRLQISAQIPVLLQQCSMPIFALLLIGQTGEALGTFM